MRRSSPWLVWIILLWRRQKPSADIFRLESELENGLESCETCDWLLSLFPSVFRESRSLGSPGVLGVSGVPESQTVNCTFAGAVIYFVMSVCALNEWSMFLFQNISRKFGFWIHLEAGGILRLSSVYCTSLVNQEAAYQISDEQTLFICFYDPALSWGDILIWNVSCKCVVLLVNFVKF